MLSVATSIEYPVAKDEADQFAVKLVCNIDDAEFTTGAAGALGNVFVVITLELILAPPAL